MSEDKKPLQVTEVALKNGKRMLHMKDNNSRHVFFSDMVVMNYWTSAILIFIVITSILIGFYTVSLITEAGNKILSKLNEVESRMCVKDNIALINGTYANTLNTYYDLPNINIQ